VVAYNAVGDSTPSNIVNISTPDVPPAAPSGLNAVASAPSPNPPTVTLTWTDNANNEGGFVVERSLGGGAFALVGIALPNPGPGTTVTFLDSTVEPKMTYTYRVAAFNAAGYSTYAYSAAVVTPGEIPQAPSNLVIAGVTGSLVRLRWVDNSTNETGFYIERSGNGGTTWRRIGTNAANDVTYRDTTVRRRTTYSYRVQAFNADGVSEYTNTVTVTTKRR
jgi:hypothetical protein